VPIEYEPEYEEKEHEDDTELDDYEQYYDDE